MTDKKRSISYSWRLREIMAEHGMYQTTELVDPLHERGIYLSVSQVHRLATGTPERLSLQVLAALCDIFGTTPADLIVTGAENVGIRKTGTADRPRSVGVTEPRPARARITTTE